KPLEGINVRTKDGEVRFSRWERGVNFRGFVTARKENETITWHYVFDDRSFPKGSMDEHVAIGGRYFDLRDTTFRLTPASGGKTRLEIVAHYRVSTSINSYAVPVAAILGRDFLDTILGLYKHRSESAVAQG
ncbi:MAG TPA: SRPBCC family protein, partial [Lysobacter sp.]